MPLRRLTPNARVLLSLLALLALFIGIPLLLHAVVPGWWEEKHVYQYEGDSVADASDFSAANQGQLKIMAVSAYEYLLGKIPAGLASSSDPGGLGPIVAPDANVQGDKGSPGWRILNIIKQWIVVDDNESVGAATLRPLRQMFYPNGQPILNNGQPTYGVDGTGPRQIAPAASTHKDFTAINLGQMKAVAAPFYDRLAAVYAPFPYPKPWATDGGTANDFATANLGQIKRVFSFDLDADSDGDGLTDLQELTWTKNHPNQPNARVLNPFVSNAVDTDNDGLTDADEMFRLGTNPDVADTDGDGFNDGEDRYPLDNRQNDDIPPKNFAIVDLTATLPANMKDTFNTNNVSMDESGQIAFSGYSGFDGKDHVYVWKNGAIDNGKSGEVPTEISWTVPSNLGIKTYQNTLKPAALGASGTLTGVIEQKETIAGQVITQSRLPFSWKPGDSLPYGWDSAADYYAPNVANVSISPNGAHTVGYQIGGEQNALLVDGSLDTYFYSDDYSFQYYPAAVTDSGHFLVGNRADNGSFDTSYFDGNYVDAFPLSLPVSAKGEWPSSYGPSNPGAGFLERPSNNTPSTSFAMNDNHQFVTREPNGDAKFIQRIGGTWTSIPILDLLKWDGKPAGSKDDFDKYKNQLSGLTPKLISNVAPSTAGMVINGQTFTAEGTTAIGLRAIVRSKGGVALGEDAYVGWTAEGAVGLGLRSEAKGVGSVAAGADNIATGFASTAIGWATRASGITSVAIGNQTVADGGASTAMGALTLAHGSYSTAMGYQTKAMKWGATAVGTGTEAGGDGSFAAGGSTLASGNYSMAMGVRSKATAVGSLAVGWETEANSANATAMGIGTRANGLSQFVVGSYNVPLTDANGVTRSDSDALLIVGNGYEVTAGDPSTSIRRNAFVVRWNGNTETSGSVTAAGTVQSTAVTGYNKFKAPVLVAASGDISMGEFTAGPQP